MPPVPARKYFRSFSSGEPGGVLFEIPPDPPGFTWDESVDELGTTQKPPPQYESRRGQLEERLTPLELPQFGEGARA